MCAAETISLYQIRRRKVDRKHFLRTQRKKNKTNLRPFIHHKMEEIIGNIWTIYRIHDEQMICTWEEKESSTDNNYLTPFKGVDGRKKSKIAEEVAVEVEQWKEQQQVKQNRET